MEQQITTEYLNKLRGEYGTSRYMYTNTYNRPLCAYEYNETTGNWDDITDLELKKWRLKNLRKDITRGEFV